jgi:hypothetical protein
VLPGGDVPKATYKWPAVVFGPRFGAAFDLTGEQKLVLRGGVGLFYDRPSSTTISGGVNNPPTSRTVTAQFGQLQSLGIGGFSINGAPSLAAVAYDAKVPSSTQWNVGMQFALPWSVGIDASYVGQHSFNTFQTVNINTVDFGEAFLAENQDPTLAASTTPGATAAVTNLLRPIVGYGDINLQWDRGWRTYHSIQLAANRRFANGVSFGFTDTIGLYDRQQSGVRLQHSPDGSYSIRQDQAEADRLLGQNNPIRHTMRANFVWDLPDIKASGAGLRAVGVIVNDWQLSGIWSGTTGAAYTVGFSYQNGGGNVNLTGSPNYGARIRVVGDPGSGCSSDPLRQFNAAAFQGPLTNSVGLESGNSYLHGCFQSALDLAIARNIRLGGARNLQLRLDMFNAPNQAIITGRNTTINLSSPADPVTATNLPYDANGNVIDSRSRPRGAGFGVANAYQNPRNLQAQIRFSF